MGPLRGRSALAPMASVAALFGTSKVEMGEIGTHCSLRRTLRRAGVQVTAIISSAASPF